MGVRQGKSGVTGCDLDMSSPCLSMCARLGEAWVGWTPIIQTCGKCQRLVAPDIRRQPALPVRRSALPLVSSRLHIVCLLDAPWAMPTVICVLRCTLHTFHTVNLVNTVHTFNSVGTFNYCPCCRSAGCPHRGRRRARRRERGSQHARRHEHAPVQAVRGIRVRLAGRLQQHAWEHPIKRMVNAQPSRSTDGHHQG
eukprot:365467-Chlamydomonas_euryale.AAC.1